jgi:hypothetical protein
MAVAAPEEGQDPRIRWVSTDQPGCCRIYGMLKEVAGGVLTFVWVTRGAKSKL